MIYFDNASTSYPKPKTVAKAVYDAINNIGSPGRGAYDLSTRSASIIHKTREAVARLFNINDPLNVSFTQNATESLNGVISTLLTQKDHVITTCFEHNSVLRPIYKTGCQMSVIQPKTNGMLDYNLFKKALKINTKAVIVNHGSNVTGNIADINIIGKFAKDNNIIFILDVAQTAGCINIDMTKSGVDILCFTGHKGLLGPLGTGGIIINNEKNIKVKPFKVGGSGSRSFDKTHPNTMPDCFEAGTQNAHSIAGLLEGLAYINNKGIDYIYKYENMLLNHFYEGISQHKNVKTYGYFDDKHRCPVISFNIAHVDSSDIAEYLYENCGIASRAGVHCAPLVHKWMGTQKQGAVRFSFSCFNTIEEVELAIDSILKIAHL